MSCRVQVCHLVGTGMSPESSLSPSIPLVVVYLFCMLRDLGPYPLAARDTEDTHRVNIFSVTVQMYHKVPNRKSKITQCEWLVISQDWE